MQSTGTTGCISPAFQDASTGRIGRRPPQLVGCRAGISRAGLYRSCPFNASYDDLPYGRKLVHYDSQNLLARSLGVNA
jgi:hypothetical protein